MDQLSYISTPKDTCTEYKTIPQKLKERAESYPDREIIVFYSPNGERESITFSELYHQSQDFTRVLTSLGIKKGDRVIIRLYNSKEWLIIVFGLMSVGAIPVTNYIIRSDVSDLNYIQEKTDAVAMFFTCRDQNTSASIKRFVEQNSGTLKYAISVDINDDEEDILLSYRKLIKGIKTNQPICAVPLDPDDTAIIMRSSGTTGRPKLIPITHFNFRKYCDLYFENKEKCFSNAEFSWDAGSPAIQVFSGVTKVTISGNQTLFTPDQILKFIEKESCSILLLNTNTMNSIVTCGLRVPGCVKTAIHGGSPIRKEFQSFLKYIDCLFCGYGSMEAGVVSTIEIKKGMEVEENIGGYVSPGNEVKIVDDDGKTVNRGTIGSILVRNDQLFSGYYGDEEMTKIVKTPSGWYFIGDVGYITGDGKLFVLGRNGDCVTRNMKTTHVTEIENVIKELKIPQIENVAVVPVPDEIEYEEICACVILKCGMSVTRDDLHRIFDESIDLLYYKPKYVVFLDDFPFNVNGKLNRRSLTEFAKRTILTG